MKAILLANVLYKGQRYKVGDELDLDVVTAGQFEREGLAFIEAMPKSKPKVEVPLPVIPEDVPKQADSRTEPPHVEAKTARAGKKATTTKKAARGQK